MSDFLKGCPEPPTELGRYRILSSTAGARVSPLCLGTGTFGTAWADISTSVDEEQSFKILDAFAEAGGNFIDCANVYQNGQSEAILGKWMASRDNRDMMVVATKYTGDYRLFDLGPGRTVNYSGNHKKSMFLSLQASLEKLQTTYVDLLFVHMWDFSTSVEEVMDALHVLVQQSKVLYLGISDTPAWVVAAANTYARAHGKTPFSVYQGRWNIMRRDFERDIIPMAQHFGMALCAWDALGGGRLQTKKQLEARKQAGEGLRAIHGPEQTEDERKISEALEKVAAEHGTESIQQIALAYISQKTRNVIPLVGVRKVEQLQDNIKSLSIHLTDEQIQYLEGVKEFDPGFPATMIGEDPKETGVSGPMVASFAHIAWQKASRPIGRG
ncbi:Putative aryl-alcohol dehydrogenase AAD14 [Fusarium falciforme]|uniref:Putative aryl-alcohol dehydrogenase AAD14 n=1 Tax=Fusarium falciforme TaxID=195108 RepID=UPI002301EE64|nr:Putative aryl-alcohol dehydrogenase AAD14 [Fusarium falciforme]KAJ4255130.1 putative aryl-alcohol dehydrogenase aad14 [Fusarium falciforme]WAO92161.1 Putative aryl-alcohol dehydrogenase AAD14 [Fusarium falciforme]